MDDVKEIKVTVMGDGKDVTIRTGEALELLPPEKVDISGNIESPANYFKKMAHAVDPKLAVVVVDRDNAKITLFVDPANPYGAKVKGVLTIDSVLASFKINGTSRFTREQFVNHLKMNRLYFPDKEQHFGLLSQIKNFNANVNTDLQQSSDSRGNKTNNLSKKVNADVLQEFVLETPVFKGTKPVKFNVEVCYDITEGDVRFWLESVELAEIAQSLRDELIQDEIDRLDPLLVIEQ